MVDLGYVGVVSAACLARDGHHVVGIDTNRKKVEIIDSGRSPIIQPGLEDFSRAAVVLIALYSALDASLNMTDFASVETIKYVDSSWHALKVSFAIEIRCICKSLEIDSRRVMQVFCQDTKLNLSPAYLRPGFAFGGSCLPKCLSALSYRAKLLDVDTPVLSAVPASNQKLIDVAYDLIVASEPKKVGLLGLSFNEGTDDLRESPVVELVERLLGPDFDLAIFDRNVKLASLFGANKNFILNQFPHFSRLLDESIQEVVADRDVVVAATGEHGFRQVISKGRGKKPLFDLVGVLDDVLPKGWRYQEIVW